MSFNSLVKGAQLACFGNLRQFLLGQADNDVLRFQVCVYDFADPVQVVEPHEDLFGHFADQGHGDAFVVVALHDFQEVNPQNFEDHDEVLAVGPVVHEGVEQLNVVAVFTARVLLNRRGLIL